MVLLLFFKLIITMNGVVYVLDLSFFFFLTGTKKVTVYSHNLMPQSNYHDSESVDVFIMKSYSWGFIF